MKKTLNQFIILVSIIIMLTGCNTIRGIFGENSTTIDNQAQKIDTIDTKIANNNKDKLTQIGIFSYGVSYALNSATNFSPEVNVAKDFNLRVMSLSTTPAVEQMKKMQETIDNLLSNLESERAKGKKQLGQFDATISKIQVDSGILLANKDIEIKKYMNLAAEMALKTDQLQSKVNEMDRWFGLGAIWYGIKKFVVDSMWVLGIGGILFLILRLLAASNPIAGSIFSIFEKIASWGINIISIIVPKALDYAGHISKEVYNKTSIILRKIVDNIQAIKELEKKTGKDITLREVLTELDKSLDNSEKDAIDQIKKELGY